MSGTRQTSASSNTSTINTVTSGSENWETYDDGSEPEADASEVYYAKVRAAQGKMRSMHMGNGSQSTLNIRPVPEDVEGGEDGWVDEMETY